ncbi:PTS glucose transporter subunit IIB [Pseudomonas paralactis]|uniref:PTS glucose transporter subunit IIB n=1 Tax=Pseudomonas paralactis TaxID=1615673 RepID=A0A0R3AAD8_9PSED|nr:PTS transporter subunit EIIB [Pseudomonas paralactis]KRP69912.1 PTS glucose transporter subunit IIB [Pseudomonas paralactis]
MFEKLQRAFWKALTPDLVADSVAVPTPSLLSAEVLSALGGEGNVTSQQRVALTRVRVQLKEVGGLDESALKAAGIPAVMVLPGGVLHLLTGL